MVTYQDNPVLADVFVLIVSLLTGTTTQANVVIPVIYEETYDHFTVRAWRQVGATTASNPQPAIVWLAYQV